MIFIDGELATLRGTGTEDYFNTAFCPQTTFSHAVPRPHRLPGHRRTGRGRARTPCTATTSRTRSTSAKSIKVTIEHGHANDLSQRLLQHRLLVPDRAARAVPAAAAGRGAPAAVAAYGWAGSSGIGGGGAASVADAGEAPCGPWSSANGGYGSTSEAR